MVNTNRTHMYFSGQICLMCLWIFFCLIGVLVLYFLYYSFPFCAFIDFVCMCLSCVCFFYFKKNLLFLILGRQPYLLLVHEYRSPVMSRRHCFSQDTLISHSCNFFHYTSQIIPEPEPEPCVRGVI